MTLASVLARRAVPAVPFGLAAATFAWLTLTSGLGMMVTSAQTPPPPTGGPWVHKVQSASSDDGLTWVHDGEVIVEHASVPSAIVTDEGAIRIYYVDATRRPETMNCAESTDGGETYAVLDCSIDSRARPRSLDPAIVRLPDGMYRLYYFGADLGRLETQQPHSIYSALSRDGIHFTEEAVVFTYHDLVDPDVFWNGREWLMFVFGGREGTIIARSDDGTRFEYLERLDLDGWGTTAPVALEDGLFRLYAFDQRTSQTVRSFVSEDGLEWTGEPGVRLSAQRGTHLTDPYVVRLSDGTWKMIYKSGPASEAQPPPGPR